MRRKEVLKGEISILPQNREDITLWIYFCHKTVVHLVSIRIKITTCPQLLPIRHDKGRKSVNLQKENGRFVTGVQNTNSAFQPSGADTSQIATTHQQECLGRRRDGRNGLVLLGTDEK
jgi:hypothetical protein